MSFLIPSSSDTTSSTCPGTSSLIFLEVIMMGIGQKYPRVSSFTSALSMECSTAKNPDSSAVPSCCLLLAAGYSLSDEQIDASFFRLGEVRGHPGQLVDALDQRVFGNPHQPHRGRAGNKPHAEVLRHFHQLRNTRHPMLPHDPLHHAGAKPPEMKP